MKLFDTTEMLKGFEAKGEIPPKNMLIAQTLKVAWPAMLESFMVCIVGIVDTMMVGSLGPSAIAAVGLTTQPKFIALAIFLSLNVAVSSVVARRVGERDRTGANKVVSSALIITIVLTAIMSVAFVEFAPLIVSLLGGEPDASALAVEYISVIIGGLIFTTITLTINAAQRGAGNTKIAMRTNLVSNAVNVVFNYLLIGGNFGFPELGVRGAAIATVIGSVCACVMAVGSLLHKNAFLYIFDRSHFGIDRKSIPAIMKIGSSSLAEQLFMRIGFLIYAITVASLGTNAFAAHQIGMHICMLSYSLGEGLSFAAIALVGKSLGEKRADLAKIYGTLCQHIGFTCSCVLSVFFILSGEHMFRLFTSEPAVLEYASSLMLILCLVTFFQIAGVVYSGCLRGAGDSFYIALVSLVSIGVVRPLGSWILCYPMGLGLTGAWLGFTIDLSLRYLLTTRRFHSNKWASIEV